MCAHCNEYITDDQYIDALGNFYHMVGVSVSCDIARITLCASCVVNRSLISASSARRCTTTASRRRVPSVWIATTR